ncbi:MAG: AbrB family transcriptional regulator [Pseudorhodobacter sp.]|nr:AbrB family transcriptional regulator [Pseudorhodobacter sp.]
MKPIKIGTMEILPAALAVTLLLGCIGGAVGYALKLPLGMLLGSLVAVGGTALLGLRPLGQPIHMPQPLRMAFVPIIGLGIGGAFTPQIFAHMAGWTPSLIALCAFVPMSHFLVYRIYRLGKLDAVTAYYGTVPGGLVESVALGEGAGADASVLVLIQFLRLIITIVTVPIAFLFITGHSVGSAAGVAMEGASNPLGPLDVLILTIAGVGGYWVGRKLRFPAPIMTGPLLASALVHLTGLTDAIPPGWTIGMTQIVVGTGLGARFAGMSRATLRRGAGLALIGTLASLTLAAGFAEVLHLAVGLPITAVFLAFAPGGVTEMSLIALSLEVSVVFVTMHHVIRIVLSVSIARLFAHRVQREKT